MKSSLIYSITAALLSATAVLAQGNNFDSSRSNDSLSSGSPVSHGVNSASAPNDASGPTGGHSSESHFISGTGSGSTGSPSRLSSGSSNSGAEIDAGDSRKPLTAQSAPPVSQPAPVTRPEPVSEPAQEPEESSGSTPFYITSPLSGLSYSKGSVVTLKWLNGLDENIKVNVLTGEEATSMQPTSVSFIADGSKGEYKWTVPSNLFDGTYAFQLTFANKVNGKVVSQEAYSDQFKIVSSGSKAAKRSLRRRRY